MLRGFGRDMSSSSISLYMHQIRPSVSLGEYQVNHYIHGDGEDKILSAVHTIIRFSGSRMKVPHSTVAVSKCAYRMDQTLCTTCSARPLKNEERTPKGKCLEQCDVAYG